MLFVIAWKNIWRNKVRSLVVMVAVMLGLWAGAFVLSYVFGMINQRLDDAIGSEISHLQLHHPDFNTDYEPKFHIDQSTSLIDDIADNPNVLAVSGRVLTYGMVASPTTSSGGKIIGIDPKSEHSVTKLADNIVEGEYLTLEEKNKVVIAITRFTHISEEICLCCSSS